MSERLPDFSADAQLPSSLRSDLPVLFFWGSADPTCTQPLIKKMYKFIPRLEDVRLDGRGHWLMLEAKDDISEGVSRWLEVVLGDGKAKL